MRFSIKRLALVLLVILAGCWDSDESPNIINDTNWNYEIVVVSTEKIQKFEVAAGRSLLLPNVLKEDDFESLELINKSGVKIVLPKALLIDRIKDGDDNNFSLSKLIEKNDTHE